MKSLILLIASLTSICVYAQIPVTGVHFDTGSSVLPVKSTLQLAPVITPADATNQKLTYTSDKPGVATVNSSGLITGVAVGEATITVKTEDGGYEAAFTINLYTENLTLSGIISSGMVVQQNTHANFWGWGPPNEQVSVTASWGETAETTTDNKGRWAISLQTPNAVKGDDQTKHTLTFTSKEYSITYNDILIGDVYLCAGQSNMAYVMKPTNTTDGVPDYESEKATANYPNIRFNTRSSYNLSYVPCDNNSSVWYPCIPSTIGNSSAVAYYFAKELYSNPDINIPIGLIITAIGGASCQSFISREGMIADPEVKRMVLDPFDRKPDLEVATASTILFNGVIAPIIPFSLKGFLWYQGEANNRVATYSNIYAKLNTALINDWRRLWGKDDLPFLYVQLPAYNGFTAGFRDQQTELLTLPDTGMAVTLDLADEDKTNIHPRNKKDVGIRLARIAEARIYGQDITYAGPVLKSMTIEGSKIRISFHPASVGSGLASRDGLPLTDFRIAGNDNGFYPADAEMDGDEVLVSSVRVTSPANVAFAYENAPVPNLMNKEGLTACPFRTDTWNYNVIIEPVSTGMVRMKKTNDIHVFPIPAKEVLNIVFPEPMDNVWLEVFDVSGKLFYKANPGSHVVQEQVNVSRLPEGVYILKIHSRNTSISKKLIIQ